MHGQAKVKTTLEEKERKKKEKELKAKTYRHSMSSIFEKRKNRVYDEETLELISDVLVTNPDIYTLWNFRKEILLTFKEKSHDDLACIMSNEMRLTEICLRENPKSYAAWYHRQWILDNLPYPDLEKELFLCTKYLKLDERNFHCWDYRRAVVSRLNLAPSEELDYSTIKIEENFSNYSSWHYRSKLLPLVFPDPSGLRPVDEHTHLKELELVQAACYTDPSDSSSWFYLRWLLGRPTTEPCPIQAFLFNGKIACVFSRPVSSLPDSWIPYEKSRLIWTILKRAGFSSASFQLLISVRYTLPRSIFYPAFWYRFYTQCNQIDIDGSSKISSSSANVLRTLNWARENQELQKNKGVVSLTRPLLDEELAEELSFDVEYGQGHLENIYINNKKAWVKRPNFDPAISPALMSVLSDALTSSDQLLELEPESKWTLLTSILLMQAIDKKMYRIQILDRLALLNKYDCCRKNYYNDIRSKFIMEEALEELLGTTRQVSLSNLSLTSLHHTHYLAFALVVDLSQNNLQRSLHLLHLLISCEELILNSNGLESLAGFPILPNLKKLSLYGNNLSSPDDVIPYLKNNTSLQELDLKGNKLTEDQIAFILKSLDLDTK